MVLANFVHCYFTYMQLMLLGKLTCESYELENSSIYIPFFFSFVIDKLTNRTLFAIENGPFFLESYDLNSWNICNI